MRCSFRSAAANAASRVMIASPRYDIRAKPNKGDSGAGSLTPVGYHDGASTTPTRAGLARHRALLLAARGVKWRLCTYVKIAIVLPADRPKRSLPAELMAT